MMAALVAALYAVLILGILVIHYRRLARISKQRADRLDALRALETKLQVANGQADLYRRTITRPVEWRH
jgi:hypothetical protein